ncbi:MAG: alpha/beta hydrolase family protein, partial [Chitinophagaceae bacterium]
RHYFTYDMAGAAVKNVTQAVKVPLYDEDDDHPDDPPPHGIMGWHENDASLYVYDKYDVWKIDPAAKIAPSSLTASQGRTKKLTLRNVVLDREERWVKAGQTLLMNAFDHNEKGYSWVTYKEGSAFTLPSEFRTNPVSLPSMVVKAKQAEQFAFNAQSPAWIQLFTTSLPEASDWKKARRISDINPQQSEFNWYTVELHRWKMFDGKMSEGLLFKPEDFDPNKKYPVIFYFYERNADNRYNYRAPAPSASTVNIAWFTSNGYLVFDPNIYYKNGEPGESAYNSVVSAAKYLSKMKFVDSTKMAIQGQSWGGYQVAYIITRTPIFAAAGAGAPVSNMFSAYGGIRWGTGISRQFQYEKSQSRLGFTPWQRPDLYTKNSPLFTANKVTTPLLMMHNDKDGAVPWYQGIEFFTALRRLDKKVWMLQYNDEDHNLVER